MDARRTSRWLTGAAAVAITASILPAALLRPVNPGPVAQDAAVTPATVEGVAQRVAARLPISAPVMSQPENGTLETPRTTTLVDQRYDLTARFAVGTSTLDALERVTVTSRAAGPIDALDLSAIPRALGSFSLTGAVTVDAAEARTSWPTTTDLRVSLGRVVLPGEQVDLVVPFRLVIRPATGAFTARLSARRGIVTFGEWFPVISRLHDSYGIGDPQVSFDAGLVRLDLTTDRPLPRDAVAAEGELVTAPATTGTHWVFEARHVRDFAFAIAPRFRLVAGSVDGIAVRVSTVDGQPARTLSLVRSALHAFAALYGPYPYPTFTAVEAGDGGFSMEFPGLVFLGADVATNARVVFHEVAHQWFYALVGDDQLAEPWLDEAFATFSSAYALHATVTSCSVRPVDQPISAWPAGLTTGRWFGCSGLGEVRGADGISSIRQVAPPATCRVAACSGYFETVYQRGAVFLDRVRRAMGDTAFFGSLRAVIAAHRFGMVTSDDILGAFSGGTDVDLAPIYRSFLSHWPPRAVGGR